MFIKSSIYSDHSPRYTLKRRAAQSCFVIVIVMVSKSYAPNKNKALVAAAVPVSITINCVPSCSRRKNKGHKKLDEATNKLQLYLLFRVTHLYKKQLHGHQR